MVFNVIYILSIIALFYVLLSIRKSEKVQNIIVWIPVLFITIELIQAFYFGIIRILKLSMPISVMAVINILISALLFIFFIRKKANQKYFLDKLDLAFLIVIILYGAFFCLTFFGKHLIIRYASVDSAMHMKAARDFALTGETSWNKYLALLFDGTAMRLALPFVDEFYLYKIFNLTECWHYIMSGMIFYSAARIFTKKKHAKIILPFLTFAYLFAFPLYSTEFGFTYFTVSISVIAYIITILFLYESENIDKTHLVILLNLSLYGIFVCYTLFVPVAFASVFFIIGFYLLHKKTKLSQIAITEISIFIIPCILGMLQSYGDAGQISGGGLTVDGGCYNDVFSNYILIAPLFLLGIYFCFKLKNNILPWFFVMQLSFMAVFFIGSITGKVSAYYYMKNNNFFWLICFLLIAFAVENSDKEAMRLIYFQFFIFAILLASVFLRADEKITEKNPRLVSSGSSNFVNIYSFTRDFYRCQIIDPYDIDLYRYVYDNDELDNGIAVGSDFKNMWAYVLCGTEKEFTSGTETDFMNMLDGSENYFIVTDSDVYQQNKDFFDYFDKKSIMNDDGFVTRIVRDGY